MRVITALSGGVDSAVAAALLKAQGYDVIAMTLRLYDCSEGRNEKSCCGVSGVSSARAVAGALDIPYYVVSGEELFERRVLRYAWDEYSVGRTPNPCVACNEWMKFGLLYEQADKFGAEYVATGHHARVEHADGSMLLRGVDRTKDQSYFLFSLKSSQLRRSLFPVGELTKAQVREYASQLALPNADRAESQDACIAQRGDLAEALRVRFGGRATPGLIRDTSGKVLGRHQGIHRFTIGQRRGLGVALGRPAYVVAINPEMSEVVVGDAAELAARSLTARSVNWLVDVPLDQPQAISVQIRYRHNAVDAQLVRRADESAAVFFPDPERAVTPGQAVVFYSGERVLGGGWISHVEADHVTTQRSPGGAPGNLPLRRAKPERSRREACPNATSEA